MFFATSWDDGNKSDLKVAKLLNELNLKGTFYIPIYWKMRSISDSQIKKISKNFEIGSHSFSHKKMTLLNEQELEFELNESKKILEKIISKKIVSFAYPFGQYNKRTIVAVKKAGYEFARTSTEHNFSKPKNPLAANISLRITDIFVSPIIVLKRMSKYGSFTFLKSFKKIVDNAKKNDIIHIAGHSWEFSNDDIFEKLVDMLTYISKRQVNPITNFEILGV